MASLHGSGRHSFLCRSDLSGACSGCGPCEGRCFSAACGCCSHSQNLELHQHKVGSCGAAGLPGWPQCGPGAWEHAGSCSNRNGSYVPHAASCVCFQLAAD